MRGQSQEGGGADNPKEKIKIAHHPVGQPLAPPGENPRRKPLDEAREVGKGDEHDGGRARAGKNTVEAAEKNRLRSQGSDQPEFKAPDFRSIRKLEVPR